MHQLFALGCMSQSDINGIKQFQSQTIKLLSVIVVQGYCTVLKECRNAVSRLIFAR